MEVEVYLSRAAATRRTPRKKTAGCNYKHPAHARSAYAHFIVIILCYSVIATSSQSPFGILLIHIILYYTRLHIVGVPIYTCVMRMYKYTTMQGPLDFPSNILYYPDAKMEEHIFLALTLNGDIFLVHA